MCGIAGFFQPGGLARDSHEMLRAMTEKIRRRGPDDEGFWLDEAAGIALGHRRLAIIDLSPAGHQPMVSHDGRFVLILNGEIYNYRELREQLDAADAPEWQGCSDTEVLLTAIARWGLETALTRATGMFAIALWDRRERTLSLARDRMGEKPLYYGWQGIGSNRTLLFASDLAALEACAHFDAQIDRDALALYMRHNFIPAPRSIFSGIGKVMPGCWLCFRADAEAPATGTYWDVLAQAGSPEQRFGGTPIEAVDALELTLGAAVKRQMVSDVPLGAFLSGGIDSSVIVALMQSQSSRPVKTFTIGFGETAYNEAGHAKEVAAHLGTDHTELYVTPDQALSVIPDLASFYTEPFADSSQVPTYLVSQLARRDVTVALSGDGGDELFGGYNRYSFSAKYWNIIRRVPQPVRAAAARAMIAVSPDRWEMVGQSLALGRFNSLGGKVHKGASLLAKRTADELYLGLISHFDDPSRYVLHSHEVDTFAGRNLRAIADLSQVERMMAVDSVHYLPDDILVKVDRAAMAVSLETRVPMLDPDVVNFAWSLPFGYKVTREETKWPLRQLLYRHVPRKLIDRPKMGFGIPIAQWLRGPLREWAEGLLEAKQMRTEGYFAVEPVQLLWQQHLSGRVDNGYRLWTILMFQAWLRR